MNYWLVKSDPETYSLDNLKKDKKTVWDGVRNYQARNSLKEMKPGDLVLFYHSQIDKAVVGIAKVNKEFFQDPTTDEERWVAVELSYEARLPKPVTLDEIMKNPKLKDIGLVRQQRLSVIPLKKEEYEEILKMKS